VNVEDGIYNFLNYRVIINNCVSRTEGHREIIQALQNFRKDKDKDKEIKK
jgi:hypothetical protein